MNGQLKRNDPCDLEGDRLEQLVQRAMAGDEAVVPDIRDLLSRAPEIAEILGGDLAVNAEKALVQAYAGNSICKREAIFAKMAQMRAELAGPNPQPLERLLIERVVLSWLHVHLADCQYARATMTTFKQSDFLQRQQDRAQRRYLAAIKSLATVRRLVLPVKLDLTLTSRVENRIAPPAQSPIDLPRIRCEH